MTKKKLPYHLPMQLTLPVRMSLWVVGSVFVVANKQIILENL